MRVNESYFNRLVIFLTNLELAYNYREDSEFIRGAGTTRVIPSLKLKHCNCNWIISSRDEDLISLVIMSKEPKKTYYASIDLKSERIVSKGKVFSNDDVLGPDDFPDGVWNFAERLIYLRNNAVSFILNL